jgi:hypothetical protein
MVLNGSTPSTNIGSEQVSINVSAVRPLLVQQVDDTSPPEQPVDDTPPPVQQVNDTPPPVQQVDNTQSSPVPSSGMWILKIFSVFYLHNSSTRRNIYKSTKQKTTYYDKL